VKVFLALVALCAMGRAAELTLDKALALADANSPLIEESKAVQAGASAGTAALDRRSRGSTTSPGRSPGHFLLAE